MIDPKRRKVLQAAGGILAAAAVPRSFAEPSFPLKPVRLIVPFPPGGGTDIVGRYIALKMGPSMKQTMVVENKAGAAGMIGAEYVVHAPPDGYTLYLATTSYAVNAAFTKLPYDPVKDISPISEVAKSAFFLLVNPTLPVKTVQDLVAHAKANPGQLNFGSSGNGGITHLCGEMFKQMTGSDIVHVPYSGTGPAMTDVMGGRVQMLWGEAASTVPQVKAGKLRAIGVTTTTRIQALPDVPSISEAIPGYEVNLWYGIWGPARIPDDVVAYLNGELKRVIELPETADRFAEQGLQPYHTSAAQFRQELASDIAKFTSVIVTGGIKKSD